MSGVAICEAVVVATKNGEEVSATVEEVKEAPGEEVKEVSETVEEVKVGETETEGETQREESATRGDWDEDEEEAASKADRFEEDSRVDDSEGSDSSDVGTNSKEKKAKGAALEDTSELPPPVSRPKLFECQFGVGEAVIWLGPKMYPLFVRLHNRVGDGANLKPLFDVDKYPDSGLVGNLSEYMNADDYHAFVSKVNARANDLNGRPMVVWPDLFYHIAGLENDFHMDGCAQRGLYFFVTMAVDGWLMDIGELSFYLAERLDGPEGREPGKLEAWVAEINEMLGDHNKKVIAPRLVRAGTTVFGALGARLHCGRAVGGHICALTKSPKRCFIFGVISPAECYDSSWSLSNLGGPNTQ